MSNPVTIGVGLFTRDATRQPVPLAGVSIEADLRSFYARVVVSHRYVNRELSPIEAVYVFPLDEGAAVCGFEAIIDGSLVVGEVLERDKAFDKYDDAMEQGHGAFLLDEERPDVFQASIGNLPPGKEVIVKLTYVTELPIADGRLRFVIPTTMSPRYAPAEDQRGTGRPDSEALNPPVAWTVPYGLNLSVRVGMPGEIAAIESPSHPIAVRMSGHDATISLGQSEAALDRDFVLSIEAAGLDVPHAAVERGEDGSDAIAVGFAPNFAVNAIPAEVIFLVDRSGSMAGPSIEEVRKALQLCLRSFTAGCRFNIVGFGSRHESLFPESRAYDDSALNEASRFVERMAADLGGTELLPALRSVLGSPSRSELPRQVVVLTDGQVTNTDAVIALAASHSAQARIFTFGIGAGASHHLVKGLARAGRGGAEFIYPGERIEPKVLRQFARLLSPVLTDVRVEWIGGTVTQSPIDVPPVFAGDRLLVYGFAKGSVPAAARLAAQGPSGTISFEVPLGDPVADPGRTVSTLAARARIRELEATPAWISTRGSRQHDRKVNSARDEIIALSVRYGLISRETSFVAVERRDTPVLGDVQLRRVPVALTTGWGGLQHRGGVRSSTFAVQDGATAPLALNLDLASPMERSAGGPPRAYMRRSGNAPSGAEEGLLAGWLKPLVKRPRQHDHRAADRMQRLILLQGADGWWSLTPELADILGRELAQLETAIQNASGAREEVRRAWATALALEWLQANAADREDEWRLLANKARKWLDAVQALPPDSGTWHEAARQFLGLAPIG